MPRLEPSLFRRAGRISPHLATLLPACRTIESAQLELRWIRQHVAAASYPRRNGRDAPPTRRHRGSGRSRRKRGADGGAAGPVDAVARLVARRGAGEPLQYVLGSQPFADLDILCDKGVLIPRPETEAWVSKLADMVFSAPFYRPDKEGKAVEDLRVLDLCSGTGCIGLSLYMYGLMELGRRRPLMMMQGAPPLRVFGFDVEPRAVRLAKRNLAHNFQGSQSSSLNYGLSFGDMVKKAVTFRQADIFTDEWMAYLDEGDAVRYEDEGEQTRRVDILVSNPPYISQRGFQVDTGRSVRNYEPKIALVPTKLPLTTSCAPEDIFYKRLLDIADTLLPRIAVFEVGDMKQAIRVVEMALVRSRSQQHLETNGTEHKEQAASGWDVLEIWRDSPDSQFSNDEEQQIINVCGREVPVRGMGHGRVVFLMRVEES
ncbi:S-adenosyl-L-methionine-dependent methyltransferase [Xylaria bambusicola]|uniref:S-adenosyl-L-methionine-dependent methyltransferase n=1 Tax=Xylaria bambusicola TaxID=326684 RepID=UPI0020083319|nr:S-adenosyl-L-methionine-dependent methyltransferase [Xylaria bambusicola]KAI0525403.1 S-adenosyl-L-methionine-dependent methyltransferase [Xylaria bambusicola]